MFATAQKFLNLEFLIQNVFGNPLQSVIKSIFILSLIF